MSGHESAEKYELAIKQFEKYLRVADDGTLKLDAAYVRSIEVNDPVVFADLSRSLEITNKMIMRGEITSAELGIRS